MSTLSKLPQYYMSGVNFRQGQEDRQYEMQQRQRSEEERAQLQQMAAGGQVDPGKLAQFYMQRGNFDKSMQAQNAAMQMQRIQQQKAELGQRQMERLNKVTTDLYEIRKKYGQEAFKDFFSLYQAQNPDILKGKSAEDFHFKEDTDELVQTVYDPQDKNPDPTKRKIMGHIIKTSEGGATFKAVKDQAEAQNEANRLKLEQSRQELEKQKIDIEKQKLNQKKVDNAAGGEIKYNKQKIDAVYEEVNLQFREIVDDPNGEITDEISLRKKMSPEQRKAYGFIRSRAEELVSKGFLPTIAVEKAKAEYAQKVNKAQADARFGNQDPAAAVRSWAPKPGNPFGEKTKSRLTYDPKTGGFK